MDSTRPFINKCLQAPYRWSSRPGRLPWAQVVEAEGFEVRRSRSARSRWESLADGAGTGSARTDQGRLGFVSQRPRVPCQAASTQTGRSRKGKGGITRCSSMDLQRGFGTFSNSAGHWLSFALPSKVPVRRLVAQKLPNNGHCCIPVASHRWRFPFPSSWSAVVVLRASRSAEPGLCWKPDCFLSWFRPLAAKRAGSRLRNAQSQVGHDQRAE